MRKKRTRKKWPFNKAGAAISGNVKRVVVYMVRIGKSNTWYIHRIIPWPDNFQEPAIDVPIRYIPGCRAEGRFWVVSVTRDNGEFSTLVGGIERDILFIHVEKRTRKRREV